MVENLPVLLGKKFAKSAHQLSPCLGSNTPGWQHGNSMTKKLEGWPLLNLNTLLYTFSVLIFYNRNKRPEPSKLKEESFYSAWHWKFQSVLGWLLYFELGQWHGSGRIWGRKLTPFEISDWYSKFEKFHVNCWILLTSWTKYFVGPPVSRDSELWRGAALRSPCLFLVSSEHINWAVPRNCSSWTFEFEALHSMTGGNTQHQRALSEFKHDPRANVKRPCFFLIYKSSTMFQWSINEASHTQLTPNQSH